MGAPLLGASSGKFTSSPILSLLLLQEFKIVFPVQGEQLAYIEKVRLQELFSSIATSRVCMHASISNRRPFRHSNEEDKRERERGGGDKDLGSQTPHKKESDAKLQRDWHAVYMISSNSSGDWENAESTNRHQR